MLIDFVDNISINCCNVGSLYHIKDLPEILLNKIGSGNQENEMIELIAVL